MDLNLKQKGIEFKPLLCGVLFMAAWQSALLRSFDRPY